jgi:hypothetical protein
LGRQELHAAGEDSTPRTPTALDLLTPMELRIAQLAADGLTAVVASSGA